uniref:Zinc finger PHD-type domain-containing protein n=1 Tax=Rhipicephalus appendiculatus TaxID=34631 RepID=A0A131YW53_RHIAP
MASCECCGKSVAEIKCPASLKGASFKDASKNPQYLNTNLQLKQDQAYYTQVQAQMAATKLHRAYFLVCTGVSFAVELISFNKSFWSLAEPKAASFLSANVFPELQTKLILKQRECAKETCYGHGTKSGRIVQCSLCTANFHLKCIKLKRTPKSWTCSECQLVRGPG